jgi:hypothetical protein
MLLLMRNASFYGIFEPWRHSIVKRRALLSRGHLPAWIYIMAPVSIGDELMLDAEPLVFFS